MKLSVKGLAITSGLVWGGSMLTLGLINLASPSYARRFLNAMSSIYPGFHNSRTLPDVLVGACYGFTDGAATGALFATLYNRFAAGDQSRTLAEAASEPAVEQLP